jgi:hypothetical protein
MNKILYHFNLILVLLICFIVFIPKVNAQEDLIFHGHRHKVGFISGYGDQFFLDVSYSYHVYFLQAQYYYSLVRKQSWSLEVLLQPQYNLTSYRPVDSDPDRRNGYEYGLNAAILIRKNLEEDHFSLYAFLGTGPHYVSDTPKRQANGFIFSDNLFIGANIKLIPNLYLDIRPGFRHISNLGLQDPNWGIHTFVMSGGLLFTL